MIFNNITCRKQLEINPSVLDVFYLIIYFNDELDSINLMRIWGYIVKTELSCILNGPRNLPYCRQNIVFFSLLIQSWYCTLKQWESVTNDLL